MWLKTSFKIYLVLQIIVYKAKFKDSIKSVLTVLASDLPLLSHGQKDVGVLDRLGASMRNVMEQALNKFSSNKTRCCQRAAGSPVHVIVTNKHNISCSNMSKTKQN